MNVETSLASPMPGAASSAGAAAPAAAVPANPAANGLGQDAFLKLLVTELQNQDPTSPESGSAFIAQLAQFSSLQQLTGINQSVASTNQLLGSVFGAIGSLPGATAAQNNSPLTGGTA